MGKIECVGRRDVGADSLSERAAKWFESGNDVCRCCHSGASELSSEVEGQQ